MTLEFRKKYTIVKSIIDNFQDNPFTIGEIYLLSDQAARNNGIIITPDDVIGIILDLYDSFDINKEVAEGNVIRYRNNNLNATVSGR